MLMRSSLETKKLELMSEISGLKLRQASVERENMDLKRRLGRVILDSNHQEYQSRPSSMDVESRSSYHLPPLPSSNNSRVIDRNGG